MDPSLFSSVIFSYPKPNPECQEEEYRIVFFHLEAESLSPKLNHEIKFRDRNGMIGHLPVREIVIGPKNNIDIAEHGIDFLLYRLKSKNVAIRRSGIPLR